MSKVTIKSLQEQIDTLKSINYHQNLQIGELNSEISSLKSKENIVTKDDFNALVKQLENEKLISDQYKKLYEDLMDRFRKERSNYIIKINKLQQQLKGSEIKLNERNAGRKAYSNKKVIQMIYELYISGKSLQGIANELNRLEIKTNRNKEWSKSSIRFILLNKKNVINEFIEEDIFKRTGMLLNDNRK